MKVLKLSNYPLQFSCRSKIRQIAKNMSALALFNFEIASRSRHSWSRLAEFFEEIFDEAQEAEFHDESFTGWAIRAQFLFEETGVNELNTDYATFLYAFSKVCITAANLPEDENQSLSQTDAMIDYLISETSDAVVIHNSLRFLAATNLAA